MDMVALEESEIESERDRMLLQRIKELESERSRMAAEIQEMMGERDRARVNLRQAQVRGDKLQQRLDKLEITKQTRGIDGWAQVKIAAKCFCKLCCKHLFMREVDMVIDLLRFARKI